jgi:hypothetical protein
MCREVSTIATAFGIALRPSVDSHYTCVSNQIQAAVAKICLLVQREITLFWDPHCLLCSKITELPDQCDIKH